MTNKSILISTGRDGGVYHFQRKVQRCACLQNCCTVDYLSKKRKANEREVPQYYVEGSHDAIIELTEWQFVQTEM